MSFFSTIAILWALLAVYAWIRSWRQDVKDMREEDADWTALDRKFWQLRNPSFAAANSHMERARRQETDTVYNKWMNRHYGTIDLDYAAMRRG